MDSLISKLGLGSLEQSKVYIVAWNIENMEDVLLNIQVIVNMKRVL